MTTIKGDPQGREIETQRCADTYHNLHFHVVFSTRDRQRSIAREWRADLHAYIGGVIRGQGGVPVAVGGVSDHVHILMGLKPSHRLSDVMREIKHESSRWMKETKRMRAFSWQKGYGAFTVSPLGCERVRDYVLSQSRRHPENP